MPEEEQIWTRPKVILLDVYETLFDMSDVRERMNDLLGSNKGYALWFESFMQYCFVDNCTCQFHEFSAIAKATMQMMAKRFGRNVSDEDFDRALGLLRHLPLHDGVQEGLSALIDLGYRLGALTNSPENVVSERMEPTGLISYFEQVLSAEKIKKYKPALEVYQWAAKKMGVEPGEVLLVSAHGWDICGAACSGMQTAYLHRERQVLYPLTPTPTFICKSLPELVSALSVSKAEQN